MTNWSCRDVTNMNVKIITFGLLIALTAYGMNSVFAADTIDNESTDITSSVPVCDEPLYNGSGYKNGTRAEGMLGNQRGEMDGSTTQLKSQLKDDSEAGGMYNTDQ